MWSALLSWVTVGVTVPVIVGIGIGVLSMSPPHYSISQVCFSVSAAILAARLAWWIAFEQSGNTTNVQRGLFAFLIFGANWRAVGRLDFMGKRVASSRGKHARSITQQTPRQSVNLFRGGE